MNENADVRTGRDVAGSGKPNTVKTTRRDERKESGTVPVIREDLQVGKRAVQRGAVRVHSHVRSEPVHEDVRLREEHVRVDRRPVDRPASEADIAAANRDAIEVVETVEEPVVNKRSRVVEEVTLSKDVGERTERVSDTVRNSEVKVEDLRKGRTTAPTTYDPAADFRSDFATRYGSQRDARFEDYEPAYRYGYDMASDPRYKGRRFDEVESDIRADYARRYPNSTWERMKDSIRYGWDKVTGRA